MQQVAYQLSIVDLTAHLIAVKVSFTPVGPEPVILRLPGWIPGSYLIRNFARHLADLRASDAAGALQIRALDKQSWQLSHRGEPVEVCYQVYAFDLSVRACFLNDEIAVINPAACCLAVAGFEATPHHVAVPPVPDKPSWKVATGLTRLAGTAPFAFGYYLAQDYQQLIDTPLLLADFCWRQFDIASVPHYLVFAGAVQADLDRIGEDLQLICQQHLSMFGTLPADLTEYWFLNWIVDSGYGGLEHHNSTLLLCSRYDLPNPQRPEELTDDYQTYLALCSHEYFHTWWVKRAKPATFLNYQLAAEQYTSQLWLYEGFTSYYDDLALVRAGLIQSQQYLTTLSKTLSRVQRAPSNTRQSLADSSFTAWTKFYQQDENAVNSVVSYYAKGSLVAWCLDAALRLQGLNLDALMQRCWQAFGASGLGSQDDDFFAELQAYSDNTELTERCRSWVYHSVELPLAEAAAALGLHLNFRAGETAKDLSGAGSGAEVRDFGGWYQEKNDSLLLTAVPIGSAAYKAGLMVGDQIMAVGGFKATEQNFNQLCQRLPLGDSLMLHYFRQQRLLTTTLTLTAAPKQIAMFEVCDDSLLQKWLQPELKPDAMASDSDSDSDSDTGLKH